jgi:hypothetical protein
MYLWLANCYFAKEWRVVIEELPFDLTAGQQLVEQLVDQWLADYFEGVVAA